MFFFFLFYINFHSYTTVLRERFSIMMWYTDIHIFPVFQLRSKHSAWPNFVLWTRYFLYQFCKVFVFLGIFLLLSFRWKMNNWNGIEKLVTLCENVDTTMAFIWPWSCESAHTWTWSLANHINPCTALLTRGVNLAWTYKMTQVHDFGF